MSSYESGRWGVVNLSQQYGGNQPHMGIVSEYLVLHNEEMCLGREDEHEAVPPNAMVAEHSDLQDLLETFMRSYTGPYDQAILREYVDPDTAEPVSEMGDLFAGIAYDTFQHLAFMLATAAHMRLNGCGDGTGYSCMEIVQAIPKVARERFGKIIRKFYAGLLELADDPTHEGRFESLRGLQGHDARRTELHLKSIIDDLSIVVVATVAMYSLEGAGLV